MALHFIMLSISTQLNADEICTTWEKKIEPDMQMKESDFTLERFQKATEYLKKDREGFLHGFAKSNQQKFVIGYKLKNKALESKSASDINEFCRFLVNDAFYSD